MGKNSPTNAMYFYRIKVMIRSLYIIGAGLGISHILNHWGDIWSIIIAVTNVAFGFIILFVIAEVLYGFAALVEYAKKQTTTLDKIYQEITKDKESEEKN